MAAGPRGSYKRRSMHLATPRTLLFLERGGLWLFLRGSREKWFAGRLNGLGGSVEPGEGVLAAARRECVEECGLAPTSLRLAAVVHTIDEPPVMIFALVGRLPPGALIPTPEGEHVWLPATALADAEQPFVADLRTLFPRVVSAANGAPPLSFTLRPPLELEDDGRGACGREASDVSWPGEGTREGRREMRLQHCKEVEAAGLTGPTSVTVTSADGPGTVDVIGSTGTVHGSVGVPGSGSVAVPDPGKVRVHYRKDPGGPDEIEASVS